VEQHKPEEKKVEEPPKPVEPSKQVEPPKQEEKKVEEPPKPVEPQKPVEAPKPAESPKPEVKKVVEPPKAVEAPKPMEPVQPAEVEFKEEPPPLPKPAPLYAGASTVVVENSPGLEVNTLVLRSAATTVAFCAVDTAAVDQNLFEAVAARLANKGVKIHPRNLLLTATGVPTGLFSGSMQSGLYETMFGAYRKEAAENAAEHIATAIADTQAKLVPARIRVSEAEAPGFQVLRSGGSVTADSTVSILYVESQNAKAMACMVNYAIVPAIMPGTGEVKDRGLPGIIARAIDMAAGEEIPVLVLNGAAGDIEPKRDIPGGPEAMGAALAELIQSAWKDLEGKATAALNCWSQAVNLPATLAPGLLPGRAVLNEVRLDDTVFVGIPGLPSAQIGLLLRAKAMSAGAEHVFLLALTNGYTGFHPNIEEYFSATPPTYFSLYGPAMIVWYGDRCLRWANAEPIWNDVPLLSRYASAYKNALERGQREKVELMEQWEKTRAAVAERIKAMDSATLLPKETQPVVKAIRAEERQHAVQCLWPASLRRDAADFTEEQRVILMGIAEGSKLPFDAVLLMQVLSKPESLPQEFRAIVKENAGAGFNLL